VRHIPVSIQQLNLSARDRKTIPLGQISELTQLSLANNLPPTLPSRSVRSSELTTVFH
jgi:hypothetical protein